MATLYQIEEAFRLLTLRLLGIASNDPAVGERVRIGWNGQGAPSWEREQNVAFLMITYDDDSITQQMETLYENNGAQSLNASLHYINVVRVSWIFYGPSSFDDSSKIRRGLYRPETTEELGKNNLSFIFNTNMPMRSPELFSGQWWERVTFYGKFNEKVIDTKAMPFIETANVEIIKG